MPKGSNCALVHEYKPNYKWGVLKTELINVKWHVSNTLYRRYTRMAIKSV